MSDGQVRELERRWRASGTDADHAALLTELVRTGGLALAVLEAGALLGHPAAALLVEAPAAARDWSSEPARFGLLAALVRQLGQRDAMLAFEVVAYAISKAAEQLPETRDHAEDHDRQRLTDALFEQHDLLRRPSDRRASHLLSLFERPLFGPRSTPGRSRTSPTSELWSAARRLAETSHRAQAAGRFRWSAEAEVGCDVALRFVEAAGSDPVRLRADLARALRKMADRILPTTP